MYYVLLPSLKQRTETIAQLAARGVNSVFHYVPLHTSPAGMRFGRTAGSLAVTEDVSERLLRLPLWAGMTDDDIELVITAVDEVIGGAARERRFERDEVGTARARS
jgi:dTDP-4-amino-4,6-dideoxygalactose transaminase